MDGADASNDAIDRDGERGGQIFGGKVERRDGRISTIESFQRDKLVVKDDPRSPLLRIK